MVSCVKCVKFVFLHFFSILKQRRKCDQNGGLKSNYNIRY